MVHTIEIKVRGYHTDVFGHVNNARYLEFLEEGRWAAFETWDLRELARKGLAFTIVNINIHYRRAAVPHDVLCVETQMGRIGHRSAVLRQVVKLKGTDTIVAEADVTFVIIDTQKQKAIVLQGEILEHLQAF